jgi:hypothetical protein
MRARIWLYYVALVSILFAAGEMALLAGVSNTQFFTLYFTARALSKMIHPSNLLSEA